MSGIYRNYFNYDANGNIKSQIRSDQYGIYYFDDLIYNYEVNADNERMNNRLYHVTDWGVNQYGDELYDQGAFYPNTADINVLNNYSYDQEGRLVKDSIEEISSISWRVDGKILSISREGASSKKNLTFDYDAMGHRIAKHILSSANELEKSTYYVLDATGNVMSVYERTVDEMEASTAFYQAEKYIYGSSRLGVLNDSIELLGTVNDDYAMTITDHIIGQRSYELTNHLGNVLSTISDKPIPVEEEVFLVNQDFSASYTPFTAAGGASLSLSSGRLKVSGSVLYFSARLSLTTEVGMSYDLTFDLDLNASGNVDIFAQDVASSAVFDYQSLSTNGAHGLSFTATGTTTIIVFESPVFITRDFYLDNVVLQADESTVSHYLADIRQSTDYSPFGATLYGRNYKLAGAAKGRYGFQGQEMDDEVKGEGNSVNYSFRMHDPRLGRFFAVDPLAPKYPHNSPYAFSENRVIDGVELEGLEVVSYQDKDKTTNEYSNETQKRDATTDEIEKYKGQFGVKGNPAKDEIWRITTIYENGKIIGTGFERWGYVDGEKVKLNEHVQKGDLILPGVKKLNTPKLDSDEPSLTWKTPVGATLGALGSNSVATRGKLKGATKGTSIASSYLSKKFPQQLNKTSPKAWGVIQKVVPKSVVGMPLRSPVAGRMMGRAVPILGYSLMFIDGAIFVTEEIVSLATDSQEEYWRKSRQNVSSIGMYQEGGEKYWGTTP